MAERRSLSIAVKKTDRVADQAALDMRHSESPELPSSVEVKKAKCSKEKIVRRCFESLRLPWLDIISRSICVKSSSVANTIWIEFSGRLSCVGLGIKRSRYEDAHALLDAPLDAVLAHDAVDLRPAAKAPTLLHQNTTRTVGNDTRIPRRLNLLEQALDGRLIALPNSLSNVDPARSITANK